MGKESSILILILVAKIQRESKQEKASERARERLHLIELLLKVGCLHGLFCNAAPSRITSFSGFPPQLALEEAAQFGALFAELTHLGSCVKLQMELNTFNPHVRKGLASE